jgi:predicted nucleic acid-binding protein
VTPPLVVDASVAIKWMAPEPDSHLALALRDGRRLIAPQLIFAECTNILWKKARRGEITAAQAAELALLVDDLDVETVSLRGLVTQASSLSLIYDHPAYDCFYLALALIEGCPFVTADQALCRKLRTKPAIDAGICVLLSEV